MTRWRCLIIIYITVLVSPIRIWANSNEDDDNTAPIAIQYSVSSSSSSSSEGSEGTTAPVAANPSENQAENISSSSENYTRAALTKSDHDNSLVFLSDEDSGYVPVAPPPVIRTRDTSAAVAPAPTSHNNKQVAATDRHDWLLPIETWDREYRRFRFNTTRVQHIEAECQDDYMKIRIGFNGSFTGLVYSAGYAYDPDCMYINGTGRDYYEFFIQLNRCGTLGKNTHNEDNRKHPTKNFMWNTITVQYNPLIEEEYDEHFKVTCEYGYDFWKTVTFPFLDVEVATGNPVVFTLTPPECYMEIRYGYGTGGNRVSGPVRVGDPLTLIIYMRSKYDGFDIVVNDCYAHNGATKKIQLIDEYGCPVDDKLISRFRGSWSETDLFETQVFAYMKTFRFTGSPALYIECDVRMCHGRCPAQPCHWRNVKTIAKRSLDGLSSLAPPTRPTIPASLSSSTAVPTSLSENINLFQALRVLQEGESDDVDYRIGAASKGERSSLGRNSTTVNSGAVFSVTNGNEVCVRTGWVAALLATAAALLCLLSGALIAMCGRRRHLIIGHAAAAPTGAVSGYSKPSIAAVFDDYMSHKGAIN